MSTEVPRCGFPPRHPQRIIQLATPENALKNTQKFFYALDLDPSKFKPSASDAVNLQKLRINEAENSPSFQYVSSIYDLQNNRITDSTVTEGKKIITFSNILNHQVFPLTDILNDLLDISREALNTDVEIEFAANLDTPKGEPKILNYLQVRPIVSLENQFVEPLENIQLKDTLLYSEKAMGNGTLTDLKDIVYIKPDKFEPLKNNKIAGELEALNSKLKEQQINYILIGPGRWGSSDPWLGIPVKWPHISGARIIVESGLENYRVDPSQGTHFFHNLTSFGVGYFTINNHLNDGYCDYDWLDKLEVIFETDSVRHVQTKENLVIRIDGRSNKGVIFKPKRN